MNRNFIHQITLPTPYAVGDVHVYVYKGECIKLFDAGVNTDEAWDRLIEGLQEIDLKPTDIEQIVLTHQHPDHIGLVGRFGQHVKVLANRQVEPWLTRSETFINHYTDYFYRLYDQWGVPEKYRSIEKTVATTMKYSSAGQIDEYLAEGDVVHGIPGLKVIETPGHAQSHLSFYDAENQLLIGGDVLIKHISSNPLLEPPMNFEDERHKPLLEYRQSMIKLLDYDIQEILPGHGKVIRDHKELIRKRLEKQEKRANQVLEYLKQNDPLTPFEICKWLFPKQYEAQLGLTLSETIGQLDYLQHEAVVQTKEEQGVIYFTPSLTHQT